MWAHERAKEIYALAGERIYRRYGECILNVLKTEYYDEYMNNIPIDKQAVMNVINGVLIAYGEEMI